AFFFSSRRRHTRFSRDWSSDVCSSDLDWSSTSLTSALSVRQRETPSSQSRRAARDAASASSYEDSRAATARLFGGGGEGLGASGVPGSILSVPAPGPDAAAAPPPSAPVPAPSVPPPDPMEDRITPTTAEADEGGSTIGKTPRTQRAAAALVASPGPPEPDPGVTGPVHTAGPAASADDPAPGSTDRTAAGA